MIVSENFRPFVRELASMIPMRRSSAATLTDEALDIIRYRHGTGQDEAELEALESDERRRYVVAPRMFDRSAGPAGRAGLRQIAQHLGPQVLRSDGEASTKVIRLSSLEAIILRERFGALVVEEDIQHRMPRTPLLDDVEPLAVPATNARSLLIRVRGGGAPLAGARVVLLPKGSRGPGYVGSTDERGELRLSIRAADTKFAKVIVMPRANFWSRCFHEVALQPSLDFAVAPLPARGFGWGHVATGAPARGARQGRGIRIAIIDSGIAPHPSLHVAGGKNFILGEPEDAWGNDVDGHGTHCAGVVAALAREGGVWGYAPEVELYALRVFGGPDGGGYASDIVEAIRWAIERGCDLINLSLSSATPSGYLRQGIEEAFEAGAVCIAAAGNEGGAVGYPAGFPRVLAVSAIGRRDAYPEDSIHADAQIEISDSDYFVASFSNRGPEIALCAPGVAITSTVPGGFSAWDGTSMACPHVTGVAALVLEATPEIASAPRTPARARILVDRLLGICQDLGMNRAQQGAGLPQLGLL